MKSFSLCSLVVSKTHNVLKAMKISFSPFRYYKRDKDVKDDVELQAYLNEVSLSGTGPNGGIGRVRETAITLL